MKDNYQSGFIVPTILISVFFIVTSSLFILSLAVSNQQSAAQEVYRQNAQVASDAGLDAAIIDINADEDWPGTLGEVTLYDDGEVRTTYETSVTDISENEKTITTTGRTYRPASSSTPKFSRTYQLDVRAVTSGFGVTSVVTGVGGLVMNNNSKITGGDVVVNGTINMDNNSQIGLSTTPEENAVNVRVAHTNCPNPPDSTYPRVCATGENGQPITMGNNARIYADVRATNQTTGTYMSNPGLIPGQTVPPVSLPSYDRTSHPVAVTHNASDSAVKCPNNNGNITWPADVKIIGDIDMGNNCTITVTGNVWITGRLHTGNQGEIIVADALGTTPPVIMIDGSGGFDFANNGDIVPNSAGTGVELRTFWSHNSSGCSPDCTDVTGTALASSQNQTTIDLGNNGEAPNSVFIAQWSRVRVSNNGSLGAVAGQSIELSNQAVINFTASVPGSNNLTKTWVKRGYLRVFQ